MSGLVLPVTPVSMNCEKNKLVSLVWSLREQLEKATTQNELLQKQRGQLGLRVQQMEQQMKGMAQLLHLQKKQFAVVGSYLFLFILCWVRQRLYNRALVHDVMNHRIAHDSEEDVEDELEEEDDILGGNEDVADQEQDTAALLSMKVNLSGTPKKKTVSTEITELAEGIIDRFETTTETEEHEGQIIVDSSVLAKVQRLRMQLEDFQTILKLNESPVGASLRSPVPSPKKKATKRPHYMKHRRTNSSNMRHSLEAAS